MNGPAGLNQRRDGGCECEQAGKAGGGKISRVTEKAQEEAAKDRAREGGYQ